MPNLQKPREWWHRQSGPSLVVKQWLKQLEYPIAILAGDDAIGVQLTMACADLELRVPEEVAIVGVDNEEVLCEFSNPTLTSIPCDTERMGYEAAALLDRLMKNGDHGKAEHIVVPPLPIVVRSSSDCFATNDPAVLAALRLIHQDDHPAQRVPQVVAASGLSRRALEQRFRRELNRTIHDEIHRARMQRACHLLLTTTQPVAKIAMRTGFSSPQRFYAVFGQTFGMSALDYREKQRLS
jgi:LacI family transcriptional regulator